MKIILGTDGSTHAQLAETVLLRLPLARSAEIIVAAVSPPPAFTAGDPMSGGMIGDDYAQVIAIERERAEAEANRSAERLRAAGMSAKAITRLGDPAGELIAAAEEYGASLIAVGSHGVGGFMELLLGSVAKALVNKAPCSVLIARHAHDVDPEITISKLAGRPKLSVAVGVDGSDGSNIALKAIIDQGKDAFAAIYALCAEPIAALPMGMEPESVGLETDAEAREAKEIVRKADLALDGLAPITKGAHRRGAPAEALKDMCVELGVDLLAIGASRHGFFERFLLGSVSYDLASSAPCSVWVVRPIV